MGRLTKKNEKACHSCESSDWCEGGCFIDNMITKLAHYEDLEEQGRLIEQKYGHYKRLNNGYGVCSECRKVISSQHNYCPRCGAKMVAEAKLKELEGVKE